MTKLLEAMIARVLSLPDAEQDRTAAAVLSQLPAGGQAYRLAPDQISEARDLQSAFENGTLTYASDAEMAALWKECGL